MGEIESIENIVNRALIWVFPQAFRERERERGSSVSIILIRGREREMNVSQLLSVWQLKLRRGFGTVLTPGHWRV